MVSWKDYYMQVEQCRARQHDVAMRRLARAMRRTGAAPASPWKTRLGELGGRLIVWGQWLQARHQPQDAPAQPHV